MRAKEALHSVQRQLHRRALVPQVLWILFAVGISVLLGMFVCRYSVAIGIITFTLSLIGALAILRHRGIFDRAQPSAAAALLDKHFDLKDRFSTFAELSGSSVNSKSASLGSDGARDFIDEQITNLIKDKPVDVLVSNRLLRKEIALIAAIHLIFAGIIFLAIKLLSRPSYLNPLAQEIASFLEKETELPVSVKEQFNELAKKIDAPNVDPEELHGALERARESIEQAKEQLKISKEGKQLAPSASSYSPESGKKSTPTLKPTPIPVTPTPKPNSKPEALPSDVDVQHSVSSSNNEGDSGKEDKTNDSGKQRNNGGSKGEQGAQSSKKDDNEGSSGGQGEQKDQSNQKNGKSGKSGENGTDSGAQNSGSGDAKKSDAENSQGQKKSEGEESNSNQEKGDGGSRNQSKAGDKGADGGEPKGGDEKEALRNAEKKLESLKKKISEDKGEQGDSKDQGDQKKDGKSSEPNASAKQNDGAQKGENPKEGSKESKGSDSKQDKPGEKSGTKSSDSHGNQKDTKSSKEKGTDGAQGPDGKQSSKGQKGKDDPSAKDSISDHQPSNSNENASRSSMSKNAPHELRDLEGKGTERGIDGPKGFKDIQVEEGNEERADTRFTDPEGQRAKNPNEARLATSVSTAELAKPEVQQAKDKQRIPPEYRDLLK